MMNKKIQYTAAFALVSLLSATGGYFAGWNSINSTPTPEKKDTPAVSRKVPRLIMSMRNSTAVIGLNGKRDLQGRELDMLLSRYARMTPEELGKEMALWQKRSDKNRKLEKNQKIALAFLAYRWGQTNPEQAVKYLKDMDDILAEYATPKIMQGWAESNLEAAAAYYLEHNKDLRNPLQTLKVIAGELGHSSPDNALKWVYCLDREKRRLALPTLLKEIGETFPEQLFQCIGALAPEDLENKTVLKSIDYKLLIQDWEATNSWLDTLKENARDQALDLAFLSLAAMNPEKAVEEFKKLDNAMDQSIAKNSIAQSMVEANPERAIQWMEENDANVYRALTWARPTPSGLKEYAEGLKDGPVKDDVLSYLILNGIGSNSNFIDYDELLSLADGIKGAHRKQESIKEIFRFLGRESPQKAKEWLEKATVSEELKENLNKSIQ